ncbi:MAG: hypothetical protein ACI81O_000951 [Cyclobacteriaceae bacterium]|jgi:hypothetical protein
MPSPAERTCQVRSLKTALALVLCLGLPGVGQAANADSTSSVDVGTTPNGPAVADTPLPLTEIMPPPVDYEPWYQVEIILFANLNPVGSNEAVTAEKHVYPNDILSVGPETNDQLAPLNSGQQAHLADDKRWFDSGERVLLPDVVEPGEAGGDSAFADSAFADSAFGDAALNNQTFNEPAFNDAALINEALNNELLNNEPLVPMPTIVDEDLLARALDSAGPTAFSTLKRQDRNLNSIASSISRSSAYRLLSHQAWRQPMTDKVDAVPILLQLGDQLDGLFEIDGTLEFYRSRYLHVITDLWFTRTLAADESQPLVDQANLEAFLQQPATTTVSVPMRHSRRMRSATLHFIDHPQFGMLIKIDRYAGPSDD